MNTERAFALLQSLGADPGAQETQDVAEQWASHAANQVPCTITVVDGIPSLTVDNE